MIVTPECPDVQRLHGPTLAEAAVRVHAEQVTSGLVAQRALWSGGFTRRSLIAGASGVAALGAQLATAKVSFAAPGTQTGTLVMVSLRGGLDGLTALVPANDPNLLRARPDIAVPASRLLSADRGFGLHPAMQPLHPYWKSGRMAALPAVSSPDLSRSHFQATDCLERGAASTAVTTGWLDRVLAKMGPGTTFRAISEGGVLPRSLAGTEPNKLVLDGIASFQLETRDGLRDKTLAALRALHTGLDHPLSAQGITAVDALVKAEEIIKQEYAPAVPYPDGAFAGRLLDIARLIKADVGVRVATVEIGGWDTHTNVGRVDDGYLARHLAELSKGLAAFAGDLGDRLDDVTLVMISEFGRRLAQNGSGGLDHGHGGVVFLLGGGLNGARVHGRWPGLAADALDHGDVAGANDYRDVLAEALERRFGIADVATVFPGHAYRRLGAYR